MRISNITKGRWAVGFFRLCLGIIVALTLAMGGIALNTRPVQAITLHPTASFTQPVQACVPFTIPFTYTNVTCVPPPPQPFFWLGAGTYPTTWTVSLDQNTGLLTGCPDIGDVGNSYAFDVGVTEFHSPLGCGPNSYWITVTLKVVANTVTTLTITPTVYPAAWENMPYNITLTATGCSTTPIYNWIATNLPPGLALDPLTGILSGIPTPGTCGPWTVMVTCTDTSMCASATCCPPVTAPLYLYVDCWANYLALIATYPTTTCDFMVQIGTGLTDGQTPVEVDGSQQATLGGGQSETITSDPCESHLVVVAETINGQDPDIQFECIGSNSKMVTDTDNTAYFNYAKKVYIKTGSNPSGVPAPLGAGWYAVNSDFSTTTPGTVASETDQGVKLVFDSYSLPDGSTFPGRDLVFTVNNKGTVTARYKPYYLLQLKSDSPSVDESSWWLENANATWALALQPVPMPNFFGGIGGTLEPANSMGSHVMTGPYTQIIEWRPNWFWPIFWLIITLLAIAAAIFFGLRYSKRGTAGKTGAQTQVPDAATTGVKTEAVDTAEPKGLSKATPVEPIKAMSALSAKPATEKALPKAEPKDLTSDKPNFCPKCGNPVDKDAEFCKKCGNKL